MASVASDMKVSPPVLVAVAGVLDVGEAAAGGEDVEGNIDCGGGERLGGDGVGAGVELREEVGGCLAELAEVRGRGGRGESGALEGAVGGDCHACLREVELEGEAADAGDLGF